MHALRIELFSNAKNSFHAWRLLVWPTTTNYDDAGSGCFEDIEAPEKMLLSTAA